MKTPLVKSVLALVAGLVAGAMTVGGLEWVGQQVYPPPAEVLKPPEGTTMMEMVKKALAEGTISNAAIATVLIAWFVGSFVGSGLAAFFGNAAHGITIGAMLASFGVVNMVMIPHPLWFMIGAAIVLPAGTLLGISVARALVKKPAPVGY
jgi:hypothetical protein